MLDVFNLFSKANKDNHAQASMLLRLYDSMILVKGTQYVKCTSVVSLVRANLSVLFYDCSTNHDTSFE